jgi:hypothetical protein
MPCIAVIDDRAPMRRSVVRLIRQQLRNLDESKQWEVIDSTPLPEIEDYDGWIMENEVTVLVLDEKLDESHEDGSEAVQYFGHQVASHLRVRIPDLPQFIITAIAHPDDLDEEGARSLDEIVARPIFSKRPGVYVQRMIRSGQKFLDRNEGQLAEMATLSEAAARGNASPDELTRLSALRQVYLLASEPSNVELEKVVSRADRILEELHAVATELRSIKSEESK